MIELGSSLFRSAVIKSLSEMPTFPQMLRSEDKEG
jgi:hypothetical protein